MKAGVPCVTMNPDDVFDILRIRAEEVGCPLYRVDRRSVRVVSLDPRFVVMEYRGEVFTVGLPGRHQACNAVLAVEALSRIAGFEDRVRPNVHRGLKDAVWPCRMQKLLADPIVIDVTHTVGGARCLASDVSDIYGKVVLVIGMLSDKDVDGVMEALSPVVSRCIVTEPQSPRAMPAQSVADTASRHMRVDMVCPTVSEAIDAALDERGDETVLVTGSFRMAEGTLRWLESRSFRYSTPFRGSMWAERIRAAARRA